MTRRATDSRRKASSRRWSARVTRTSDALDLEKSVFRKSDPAAIARSLKRSAERAEDELRKQFRRR